jgi:ABC-2 type transport system permease protein/lipopolysaccharide transport system permease protein
MIRLIKEIYLYKDALMQLVSQNLILRYRRTVLGYFWTLLNPLLMMTVMAVVFANLFKADLKTFTVFLFAGMIPWNFFNSAVSQSAGSLIANEGIIKKIYMPKLLFPLSTTVALFIDSILAFFILFVIILLLGGSLSWALFFLPIAFVLIFIFAFGLGVVSAIATVYFRDLQYIIIIGLQGLFFLTPIFYKKDDIFGAVSWIIDLNPVVPFISLFREPILNGQLPNTVIIIQATFLSLASAMSALLLFGKVNKKIMFRL